MVINLIVAQIPTSKTQIDLSTQKMYSITDETKTALKDLDQDVTLYYIVQKGSEDDTIEKLLEHYDELSDHIKVETKDPDLYPKFTSQYTDQTVAANSVIVVCGDKSKVVSNSDMWETSTNYQTYQTQTTGFDGEGQITSAITYVTSENNPKVYWVTGHGEASESDLSTNFSDAVNKNNVEISDLALMTDDIPEDAEELVIMSPTTDFSEDEAIKSLLPGKRRKTSDVHQLYRNGYAKSGFHTGELRRETLQRNCCGDRFPALLSADAVLSAAKHSE